MRDTNTRRAAIVIGLFVVLFGVRFVAGRSDVHRGDVPARAPDGAGGAVVRRHGRGGGRGGGGGGVLHRGAAGPDGGRGAAHGRVGDARAAGRAGAGGVSSSHGCSSASVDRAGARRARGGPRRAAAVGDGAAAGARARRALRAGAAGRRRGLLPDGRGAARQHRCCLVGRRGGEGRAGGAAGGVRAHLAGHLRALRGRSGAAAAARQRGADRPGGDLGRLRRRPVCVVHRPADRTLAWALAGHPPPLRLGDGAPLDSAGAGQPLGLEVELDDRRRERAAAARATACSLYTDGILDARDGSSERLRGGAAAVAGGRRTGARARTALVEHLRAALAEYAPAGGDDVCLLAARESRAGRLRRPAG